MHHIASNDYVASRCCLLNGLVAQGHVLAEQDIQGELKNIILFHSPAAPADDFRNRKLNGLHNISDLVKRLTNITNFELSRFENLVVILTKTYKIARYPDHNLPESEKPRLMSSEIIPKWMNCFCTWLKFPQFPWS